MSIRSLFAALLLPMLAFALPPAAANDHLASLVVEEPGGQVVHAWNANRPVYPASLTKLMTAYLVFDAMADGRVQPDARYLISSNAAAQPPTDMRLTAGKRVPVDVLLNGLLLVSANDAAVALAEGLMGSEGAFVRRMNEKAASLGLSQTRFVNASGLPGAGQRTTARDMARLSLALRKNFPGRLHLFSKPAFRFAGRRLANINGFLNAYDGASGMKTGFTCKAGYNLVASAARDGRRLVGVVMGAPSPGNRAAHMRRVLNEAWSQSSVDSIDLTSLSESSNQGAGLALVKTSIADRCTGKAGVRVAGWSIDIGAKPKRGEARKMARGFIRRYSAKLPGARVRTVPRWIGVKLHRALVTGLKSKDAIATCISYRETGGDCVVIPPESLRAQLDDVQRIRKLQRLVKEQQGSKQ